MERWEGEGARAFTRTRRPDTFVEQHAAPLFYRPTHRAEGATKHFATEVDFWSVSELITFASVRLDGFRLSDWFPRTPGVYWSRRARSIRKQTFSGPATNDPELGRIFAPAAKRNLIEDGGIGTIRLRPRRIDGTDCWLATAVKGRQCAGGVPLALPDTFLAEGKVTWGDTAIVHGTVRFLQEAGLEDIAAYVHHASPVIIFVEKLEGLPSRRQSATPIVLTPVALFDQKSDESEVRGSLGGRFGYTFVHCVAGPGGGLDGAADWIEAYAARHRGRIITNFDERSPILSNAPLSYQRLINKTYDRVIIKQLDLQWLAERIDVAVMTEYNNYGNVAAMGDDARSDNNVFLGGPSDPAAEDPTATTTGRGSKTRRALDRFLAWASKPRRRPKPRE
jgi:hypothetical protein